MTWTSSLNCGRRRTLLRRVRPYPGTVRGLFASPNYLKVAGNPSTPEDLTLHKCVGSGPWKLSKGKKVVMPDILFRVVTSDPTVALKLALSGFGIVILPLWMAKNPDIRNALAQILPQWVPEPITLCALFSSPSRLTPSSNPAGLSRRIPGNRSRPEARTGPCQRILHRPNACANIGPPEMPSHRKGAR